MNKTLKELFEELHVSVETERDHEFMDRYINIHRDIMSGIKFPSGMTVMRLNFYSLICSSYLNQERQTIRSQLKESNRRLAIAERQIVKLELSKIMCNDLAWLTAKYL